MRVDDGEGRALRDRVFAAEVADVILAVAAAAEVEEMSAVAALAENRGWSVKRRP